MTKEQILNLAKKYPIAVDISEEDYTKNIASAISKPEGVESCDNHLDVDFMEFLASGQHLNEDLLPFAI